MRSRSYSVRMEIPVLLSKNEAKYILVCHILRTKNCIISIIMAISLYTRIVIVISLL